MKIIEIYNQQQVLSINRRFITMTAIDFTNLDVVPIFYKQNYSICVFKLQILSNHGNKAILLYKNLCPEQQYYRINFLHFIVEFLILFCFYIKHTLALSLSLLNAGPAGLIIIKTLISIHSRQLVTSIFLIQMYNVELVICR